MGEGDGDEALHVAGAATIEIAVGLRGQRPGIGRPWLAIDRHDVGMARQHDATLGRGADRGEKIGFGALGIGDQRAGNAEIIKVALDVFDQIEVGIARGGVEGHQALQHVDRTRRVFTHAGHRRTPCGAGPRV